jgi:hypothetical protein
MSIDLLRRQAFPVFGDVADLVRRHVPALEAVAVGEQPLGPVAGLALDAALRVVEGDAGADELHQVLVGGNDQHVGAAGAGLVGIGGDEVVGLVAVLLDGMQAEGANGGAHQRELRHEVFRRRRPVRLVERVELLAERVLALVEDHGEMRRPDAEGALLDELQHLGREQPDSAGRQAVRARIVLPVLVHRLEIGAEDEGRGVDEKDAVALANGAVVLGVHGMGASAMRRHYGRRCGPRHVPRGWSETAADARRNGAAMSGVFKALVPPARDVRCIRPFPTDPSR